MADSSLWTCPDCKDTGRVWLGSQPYGSPGESYAPCHCPKGDEWAREQAESQERTLNRLREQRERCPVCGGLNPGDITHARC